MKGQFSGADGHNLGTWAFPMGYRILLLNHLEITEFKPHMPGVTGSIPVSPTTINSIKSILQKKTKMSVTVSPRANLRQFWAQFGHKLGTRHNCLVKKGTLKEQ